jgi:hypothetical protein
MAFEIHDVLFRKPHTAKIVLQRQSSSHLRKQDNLLKHKNSNNVLGSVICDQIAQSSLYGMQAQGGDALFPAVDADHHNTGKATQRTLHHVWLKVNDSWRELNLSRANSFLLPVHSNFATQLLLAKAPRAATWELHNCASLRMSHAETIAPSTRSKPT